MIQNHCIDKGNLPLKIQSQLEINHTTNLDWVQYKVMQGQVTTLQIPFIRNLTSKKADFIAILSKSTVQFRSSLTLHIVLYRKAMTYSKVFKKSNY